MNKEILGIIPAQEKNQYSTLGDLEKFAGTSLLEWKISQLKKIKNIKRIYVLANSKKILKICNQQEVFYLKRPVTSKIADIFRFAGSVFKNKYILWSNPSSPFLKDETINKIIHKFIRLGYPEDGIVTSRNLKEYIFFNKSFLNFNFENEFMSRKNIHSAKILTNGIYLSSYKNFEKGKSFGAKTIFYDIDWLQSLEIKECYNLDVYHNLIDVYFKIEK